jgi:hypothetical protein
MAPTVKAASMGLNIVEAPPSAHALAGGPAGNHRHGIRDAGMPAFQFADQDLDDLLAFPRPPPPRP